MTDHTSALETAREAMIDAKNILDTQLACDDPQQAVSDFRILKQNYTDRMRVYLEALEQAYKHEVALREAHSEGWRTRIAVGDAFIWSSDKQLKRYNEAVNKNPHPYNSDLYRAWSLGFASNDRLRMFNALTLFHWRAPSRKIRALEARIRELEAANAAGNATVYLLLMQWNGRGENIVHAVFDTLEGAQAYDFHDPVRVSNWTSHISNASREWWRITHHRYNTSDNPIEDGYDIYWTIREMPIQKVAAQTSAERSGAK